MGEQGERFPVGPRGQQGEQGKQGERGELSRPMRRALVYLFATAAALALIALFAVIHETQHNNAVQRQQGQLVERKLCTTLDALARLHPPPGRPETNPSRAYLQEQHAVLAQLGADLGCDS